MCYLPSTQPLVNKPAVINLVFEIFFLTAVYIAAIFWQIHEVASCLCIYYYYNSVENNICECFVQAMSFFSSWGGILFDKFSCTFPGISTQKITVKRTGLVGSDVKRGNLEGNFVMWNVLCFVVGERFGAHAKVVSSVWTVASSFFTAVNATPTTTPPGRLFLDQNTLLSYLYQTFLISQ